MIMALAQNDYQFAVATDLDYYGPEADENAVADYEAFAEEYLTKLAGQPVTTYSVNDYSSHEPADMKQLRQEVWSAYLNQ